MLMPVMEDPRGELSRVKPTQDEPSLQATNSGTLRVIRFLQQSLEKSGYRELRRVQVDLCAEGLRLRGDVPCFYLKQLAQTLVLNHGTEYLVSNEIRVASRDEQLEQESPVERSREMRKCL